MNIFDQSKFNTATNFLSLCGESLALAFTGDAVTNHSLNRIRRLLASNNKACIFQAASKLARLLFEDPEGVKRIIIDRMKNGEPGEIFGALRAVRLFSMLYINSGVCFTKEEKDIFFHISQGGVGDERFNKRAKEYAQDLLEDEPELFIENPSIS